MNSKIKTFTDGFIKVYKPIVTRNEFGASTSSKKVEDMQFIVKLAYVERYKRNSDIEVANALKHSLNLKISTPLYDKVDTTMLCVVGDKLYSIYDMDIDKNNRELYLYLEEYGNAN